ncbi:DUF3275 family protein [Parachitinimonas caeni]|uniref:DUF3275 family protein n=1 Tax=Parachitinimonas caeni TaxID=3031301 RepID=A0ABT7E3Y3_9NEIS|nr:DUF3275 family protein [Parachitinimonas caeni]MDK2126759.1 DUF3275 family protein [Parachitinimonas caeni]
MIQIPGKLTIKRIPGRNGEFAVGTLVTDIGKFSVKDAVLEQYPAGTVSGVFTIRQLGLSSYTASNGYQVTEIRAHLAGFVLDSLESPTVDDAVPPMESDPLDEEQSVNPTSSVPPVAPRRAAPVKPKQPGSVMTAPLPQPEPEPALPGSPDQQADDMAAQDRALFGDDLFDLILARQSFKLDTTVDRAILRQQKVRLDALAYRFVMLKQCWEPVD